MKPTQLLPANQPLLGKHLRLERLGPAHVDLLFSAYENVGFWSAYRQHENRQVKREELQQRLAFDYQQPPAKVGKIEWVIFRSREGSGVPIGLAGLTGWEPSQFRAEFLIGIFDPDEVKVGIGVEASLLVFDFAFNQQKLNKLVTYVYGSNPRAQASTLALGFRQEGHLKSHFYMGENAGFCDVFQNGMLQNAFRENARLKRLSLKLLGKDVTKLTKVADKDKSAFNLEASFQLNH